LIVCPGFAATKSIKAKTTAKIKMKATDKDEDKTKAKRATR
jgi:hypothetical protein